MLPEPDHTWQVLDARTLYESPWVSLDLCRVRPPGSDAYDHHVVRLGDAASTLVHDPARGVLLLWRHRFIIDRHGWEVPAGRVEPGEDPAAAAARECEEETGWRPGPLRQICRFSPIPGIADHWFHVFLADAAEEVGAPDPTEAAAIAWVPTAELASMIREGRVPDGPSLLAISFALAAGLLG